MSLRIVVANTFYGTQNKSEPKPRRRAPETIRPKAPSILSRLTYLFRPKPGLGAMWRHDRQSAGRQQIGKRERVIKVLTDCVRVV